MDSSDHVPPFAALLRDAPDYAAQVLRNLGDEETADEILAAIAASSEDYSPSGGGGSLLDQVISRILGRFHWGHTSHVIGYIPPATSGTTVIRDAGSIRADRNLLNRRLALTLQRLYVAGYPGIGTHNILLDFYAENYLPARSPEGAHFTYAVRGVDGSQANIPNYRIFSGLNIGEVGLRFKCRTVNVSAFESDQILAFLNQPIFKTGLQFLGTVQPAIRPLSVMVEGILSGILNSGRGAVVHDFSLDLDFQDLPMSAHLREGVYVAAQAPDTGWSWDNWVYDGISILGKHGAQPFNYNYVAFGISEDTL